MAGGLLAALLLMQAAGDPAAALAPADGSSVADFLTRARAVNARGPAAKQSPEYAAIRAEVATITRSYRADLIAQQKAGAPQHSCPPARSGLTSTDLMAELNRIAPELRAATSVKSVYYAMMKRRYPCPF